VSQLDRTRHLQVENWMLADHRERMARFWEIPFTANVPPALQPLPEVALTPDQQRFAELDAKKTDRAYWFTDAERDEYFQLLKKLFPLT